MSLGPIEMLCIKFPNYLIKDEIASALRELVKNRTIRIIDIVFIRKNENGNVLISELDELDDIDHSILDPIVSTITQLICEDDLQMIAETLDDNSFAAVMLFENIWATAFRDAIVNASGKLLLSERIPSSVIDEVMAASTTA